MRPSDKLDKATKISNRIKWIDQSLARLGLEIADLYMVEEAEDIIVDKIAELRKEKAELEIKFEKLSK